MRERERSVRVAAVGVALAVAPLLLLLLQYGAGRDQGVYGVVARVMESGGMPYRDAWDVKPPGIFLVYRLARAVGGPGMAAVRGLEGLALVSQVVAFGLLTRRFLGSAVPGLWGGALAALVHVQLEFWHTGQPESFGGPVLAWALVLVTSPERRGALARLVAAGALFGFAGLLKPPLAGGALTVGLLLGWEKWRGAAQSRRREFLRPLLAVLAGTALVLGGTVAWFQVRGALPDLLETFLVFVPRYTALGHSGAGLAELVYRAVTESLVGYSAVIPAGLALLLLFREPDREGRFGLALVAAVVAPQLLGVALQAKFFPYHYGAILPFAALVGAWGLSRALERFPGLVPRLAAVAAVALLLDARTAQRGLGEPFSARCGLRLRAATSPTDRARILDRLHSVDDVDASENRAAAEWLATHTSKGDRVFLWGYEPVVYLEADRAPASRYVYDAPVRTPSFAAVARPRLMADLARTRPAAIVVERGDVVPQVTGDLLDSAAALGSFPELSRLLAASYEPRGATARFAYFARRAGT